MKPALLKEEHTESRCFGRTQTAETLSQNLLECLPVHCFLFTIFHHKKCSIWTPTGIITSHTYMEVISYVP